MSEAENLSADPFGAGSDGRQLHVAVQQRNRKDRSWFQFRRGVAVFRCDAVAGLHRNESRLREQRCDPRHRQAHSRLRSSAGSPADACSSCQRPASVVRLRWPAISPSDSTAGAELDSATTSVESSSNCACPSTRFLHPGRSTADDSSAVRACIRSVGRRPGNPLKMPIHKQMRPPSAPGRSRHKERSASRSFLRSAPYSLGIPADIE